MVSGDGLVVCRGARGALLPSPYIGHCFQRLLEYDPAPHSRTYSFTSSSSTFRHVNYFVSSIYYVRIISYIIPIHSIVDCYFTSSMAAGDLLHPIDLFFFPVVYVCHTLPLMHMTYGPLPQWNQLPFGVFHTVYHV